ncbi:hypothetical protein [Nocardioides sp. Root140]|uniref:hypothetical protein n=1 Tax=Nocardioides sp. Root140 TaxID=1736460 RepID=UPI0006F586B8|nr:hypothetical protein [Nocardioides sp. Root140]KQY62391.1 hypothetical protein ASD30_23740 [Nocardioides sp. Root140]
MAANGLADVHLRRVANTFVVVSPYDFGLGDPFAGDLGRTMRARVAEVSKQAVTSVHWMFDPDLKPMRRPQSSDLGILVPGDPSLEELPELWPGRVNGYRGPQWQRLATRSVYCAWWGSRGTECGSLSQR